MLRLLIIISCTFAYSSLENIESSFDVKVVEEIQRIADESDEYRLPKSVLPNHYNIFLSTRIDQGNFNFTGNVEINVSVKETINQIVLNSKLLNIDKVMVKNISGSEISIGDHTVNETHQFLVIPINGYLDPGNFTIVVFYNGILRTDDLGFYRSSYSLNGITHYLATTQFEATDARHGFPCFDEPAMKATFSIQIEYGCTYSAVSNMDGVETNQTNGLCLKTFEKTPLMSTYLIAFVISDYEMRENYAGNVTETQLKHRIFARNSFINDTEFALVAGENILKEFSSYLNVNYSIYKMDQVGIPDFFFGAMENWGLVTYRENSLYVNEKTKGYTQERRVANLIAHEFAHQWFGNHVSPEWWIYNWLNEGFATLFSALITSRLYLPWKQMEMFVVETVQPVFQSDAQKNTRKMSFPMNNPNTIMDLFDNIAYDKSGSVLRMIMYAISEERFKIGLTLYLNEREFQEANPDHLSKHLNDAALAEPSIMPDNLTLKEVLDSWHLQEGFPIVEIQFNRETGSLNVSQERYLESELDKSGQTWIIPYNFIFKSEAKIPNWMNTKADGWLRDVNTIINPPLDRAWKDEKWILFNKEQTGYYRVNYDNDNWNELIEEFAENGLENIGILNRAQLVDDSLDLAKTGRLTYDIPFKLLQKLMIRETEYFTWVSAYNGLKRLEAKIFGTEYHNKYLNFLKSITEKKFTELGINEKTNELYHINLLRKMIIELACNSGVESCLNNATELTIEYISDNTKISSYLRSVIISSGVKKLSEESYLNLWTKLLMTGDSVERNEIISALAQTQNDILLEVYITTSISELANINYSQAERVNILSAILNAHSKGLDMVIKFMGTEKTVIEKLINNSSLEKLFAQISKKVTTDTRLVTFSALVDDYKTILNETTIAEYMARIQMNIDWNKEIGDKINKWLDDNNFNNETDGGGATSSIVLSTILLLFSMTFSWFT